MTVPESRTSMPVGVPEKAFENRLVESYQVDGGFIVHDAAMLKRIYGSLGIDPRTSLDWRIYELEGLTHFFQREVASLAYKMGISSRDRVLNPGEGSGAPSRLLVRLFGCSVTGVDLNPEQIRKAREIALLHGVENKVTYYRGDVAHFSLPEKDFTKAFVNETCGHWQRKDAAFLCIHEHLLPGATVGFNIWLKGERGTLNEAYECVPEFRPLYKPGIWAQEDLGEYRRLLAEAGFKVLEHYDCTDKVDIKIRARLKATQQWDLYERALGKAARESGFRYYQGMLKTHYDFLKYGVIIARKEP